MECNALKKVLLGLSAAVILFGLTVNARSEEEPYRIGGGDILEVTVWQKPDLSRQVTVRPDGMITLPLIQDVPARGLTVPELREEIAAELSKLVNDPNVTVIVSRASSFTVYTLGALGTNGMFHLSDKTTVYQLLAMAGGPTPEADLSRVSILRKNVRVPLDISINPGRGSQLTNPVLAPGDVLIVPSREVPNMRILIAGEVAAPQVIAYEDDMSVLDAFVQAGGPTPYADLDSVKVIRREAGKKERVLRVDLNKVMKKGDLSRNIVLMPGDIIIVP
jgi:polysaccharide export outer membrane protein